MSKKVLLFFVVVLLFFNFLAWQEVFAFYLPKNLVVSFLNVGQGDSAFIQTPQGHQILIDGGPNSLALESLAKLIPVWDKTIDMVVLTHPESDHMRGLFSILQRYKADYILWTGVKRNSPDYEEWIKVLENQKNMGASVVIAEVGQKIKLGNVFINVLHPEDNLEGQELKNTSNDAGVVLKLVFGESSFLFTGDISSVAENKISNLKANVLKVAHHGSKYSTSELFLASVMPIAAVIEVGKNSYGHPTQEVLQRLEKFGIKVFRTDRDGNINFTSDGNKIYIIK